LAWKEGPECREKAKKKFSILFPKNKYKLEKARFSTLFEYLFEGTRTLAYHDVECHPA